MQYEKILNKNGVEIKITVGISMSNQATLPEIIVYNIRHNIGGKWQLNSSKEWPTQSEIMEAKLEYWNMIKPQ